MCYLHTTPFGSHGRLSSSNCLVDSRLVVKIGDVGLTGLRNRHKSGIWSGDVSQQDLRPMLWSAPEHLREPAPKNGTPAGDVFSFAIILQEIILRQQPYGNSDLSVKGKTKCYLFLLIKLTLHFIGQKVSNKIKHHFNWYFRFSNYHFNCKSSVDIL